jgi:predicted MFS family arabinose efflux permease
LATRWCRSRWFSRSCTSAGRHPTSASSRPSRRSRGSRSLGGASAWGVISAGWGVGAIVGGIVALRVRPRRPLVVATLLTTLIALPPLALALSHSVALIAVALVVFAFEVVWSNSMFTSTIQALIPDQVRSRVDSYDMLISIVIMPVGYVVAGPLSSAVGITTTLVGAAIVGAVPAALTALVPGNRAVHRTADGKIVGPEGVTQPSRV